MNSKLLMLLAAVLMAVCATNVYAQETNEVKLNVKLHQIQTLVVNPTQSEVNLEYITEKNYNDGVSSQQYNHLKVFSTGGFNVMASSSTNLTNGDNSIIESSDIKLVASVGSDNKLDEGVAKTIESLTKGAANHTLISSKNGGRNLRFHVEYFAKGDDKYINKYVKGEKPTVYTTTVTYTIIAR